MTELDSQRSDGGEASVAVDPQTNTDAGLETDSPPFRRVLLRRLLDLAMSFAIGLAIFVPLDAAVRARLKASRERPHSHTDEYSFSQLPADDAALEEWLADQPGVTSPRVTRSDDTVALRYRLRGSESVAPNWQDLGYDEPKGTSTGSISPLVYIPPRGFHWLILAQCTSLGCLAISIWRINRGAQPDRSQPTLLEGSTRRAIIAGIAVGVVAAAIGWGNNLVLRGLADNSPGMNTIWVLAGGTSGKWLALILFAAVAVPVAQELFFRGLVFGSLNRAGRPWLAMFTSSLLFALTSLNPVCSPGYLLLGLLFAGSFRLTRSLLTACLAHAILIASFLVPALLMSMHSSAFDWTHFRISEQW